MADDRVALLKLAEKHAARRWGFSQRAGPLRAAAADGAGGAATLRSGSSRTRLRADQLAKRVLRGRARTIPSVRPGRFMKSSHTPFLLDQPCLVAPVIRRTALLN